ncbi:MAG: plastocyanin/azurin family copper-binding protein [Solirubrobacterales bacterium]|nr:plastocyanin/azurin family copper-binding protein [Solirubrobacterales bacterium]
MTKKLLIPLLALTLAGSLLAACGGDDDGGTTITEPSSTEATTTGGGSSGSGGTVAFSASSGIAYDETDVSADAGSDTLTVENGSGIPHDVVIEDSDGNEVASTDEITSGSTETTADLKAGTYTFYCSVDSHREQGMEGTLTVK